jgi:antitoxin component YwqK of YwqJK toxin-antitoxin module
MKTIKISLMAASLLIAMTGMAQEKNLNPVFEEQGSLIKGTYFYENGMVQQEGTYMNGVLHGMWVSYTSNGKKTAQGFYENGIKSGKWFFWNDDKLTEVDYSQNKIAAVNTWKKEGTLVTND